MAQPGGVLIVVAVLGGVGGLLGLIGSIWFFARLLFVLKADKATGTVTGAQPRMSHSSRSTGGRSGRLVYAPTVRFQTADGRLVDFVAGLATSSQPQVGRSVAVLYRRDNPEKAQIKSFIHLWLGPIILFFVSGILLAVAGLLAVVVP